MNDRRLFAVVVALALAVGLVQLTVWWLKPAPTAETFVGPPRSGYTLDHFTLDSYGADGKLSVRLSAPQLQRREGDDSLYLNAPTFLLPPQNGASGEPWKGKSQYGWVNADATVMKLQGKVDMYRAAYVGAPSAEIHTADVTAWPKQNRLATAAPAQIRQGTSRMSSVGLRADLNSKHLELLNDFHGTFTPSSARD